MIFQINNNFVQEITLLAFKIININNVNEEDNDAPPFVQTFRIADVDSPLCFNRFLILWIS